MCGPGRESSCTAILYEHLFFGETFTVTTCDQWVDPPNNLVDAVSSLVVRGSGCALVSSENEGGLGAWSQSKYVYYEGKHQHPLSTGDDNIKSVKIICPRKDKCESFARYIHKSDICTTSTSTTTTTVPETTCADLGCHIIPPPEEAKCHCNLACGLPGRRPCCDDYVEICSESHDYDDDSKSPAVELSQMCSFD